MLIIYNRIVSSRDVQWYSDSWHRLIVKRKSFVWASDECISKNSNVIEGQLYKNQWVQLLVHTKAVCENIFSTMENRVLRLSNGKGAFKVWGWSQTLITVDSKVVIV